MKTETRRKTKTQAASKRKKSGKSFAFGRTTPLFVALTFAVIGVIYFGVTHAAAACGPAGAWTSSATNGQTTNGGYFFDNNEWNAVSGSSQTIWVVSPGNWGICSTQPNPPAGVKTYAEEQKTINKPINSFNGITNTVSYSVPSKGGWETADDLWINGTPGKSGAIEVMIWTYNSNGVPAGTKQGTVKIGQQNYTWYKKTGSSPIYTFVYTSNVTSTTVHVLNVFNFLAGKGLIKTSSTFSQFNWGFEIVGTGGVKENFTTKSFTLGLD